MRPLLVGSILIVALHAGSVQQYCDDCQLGCCNVQGNCATSANQCNCRSSYCRNQCCVDEKCGSESECATSSTLAIIIVLISIFSMCAFCFVVCLCLTRVKRKNNRRNRIRSEIDSFHERELNVVDLNPGSKKENVGVPIENVYLGQPLEFSNASSPIVEGQPVKSGNA